jgi:hypothetical protein
MNANKDLKYIETPKYLMPLAKSLTLIDTNIPTEDIYRALIRMVKYLIKYHKMETAADFYDALRRSTYEQNIWGNYYVRYKYLYKKIMYYFFKKRGVLIDPWVMRQYPNLILSYFCENKLSDRLIAENR